MKFKRFSDRNQAFLKEANAHGLDIALVIKADSKAERHDVIGVACCTSHLNTKKDSYKTVYIVDLEGFSDEV